MKKQPAKQPSRAIGPVLDRTELATVRGGTLPQTYVSGGVTHEDTWNTQR